MMLRTAARRRSLVVTLSVVVALLAFSLPVSTAEKDLFFEETAEAFWSVPFECSSGAIVDGTLLVRSTRDFESPDTEDDDPTARVQFLAVCPDGSSFSWAAPAAPAIITSSSNLKSVTATGSGIARDIFGVSHSVSFDVDWVGVGPVETTVNTAGSIRKQREAIANGQVVFDGQVLVDGPNNHPTRPAPFIRIDIEK